MMAIGALLATIGTLSLLVSAGMITTGALAPLGMITAAGAGVMTFFGVIITTAGAGLFATRHELKNPLHSLKTIETTLKKQTNLKK